MILTDLLLYWLVVQQTSISQSRSYESSFFKTLMAQTEDLNEMDEVLGHTRKLIDAFCSKHNLERKKGREFYKALVESVMSDEERRREFIDNVYRGAQGLWTSDIQLRITGRDVRFAGVELCAIINEAVKEDCHLLLPDAVMLVKAINRCLITRNDRMSADIIMFPSGGVCYRGASMPAEHISFFAIGTKFRFQRFISASFDPDVAYEFVGRRALDLGLPPIIFEIRLDPRGESQYRFRCKHVNYISNSHVPREREFLFVPYSVFTVLATTWRERPTGSYPHIVQLDAAIDNREEPDGLPLAPWC
jgi:hypothetical protein